MQTSMGRSLGTKLRTSYIQCWPQCKLFLELKAFFRLLVVRTLLPTVQHPMPQTTVLFAFVNCDPAIPLLCIREWAWSPQVMFKNFHKMFVSAWLMTDWPLKVLAIQYKIPKQNERSSSPQQSSKLCKLHTQVRKLQWRMEKLCQRWAANSWTCTCS